MRYYRDSFGSDVSEYDLIDEPEYTAEEEYESLYNYLHDQLIKKMFREKLSYSVQEMHAMIKEQMK